MKFERFGFVVLHLAVSVGIFYIKEVKDILLAQKKRARTFLINTLKSGIMLLHYWAARLKYQNTLVSFSGLGLPVPPKMPRCQRKHICILTKHTATVK